MNPAERLQSNEKLLLMGVGKLVFAGQEQVIVVWNDVQDITQFDLLLQCFGFVYYNLSTWYRWLVVVFGLQITVMFDKLGSAGYGDLQLTGSQATIPGHQCQFPAFQSSDLQIKV